eukprot:1159074-Pelagomonas_calceolata.AAC.1
MHRPAHVPLMLTQHPCHDAGALSHKPQKTSTNKKACTQWRTIQRRGPQLAQQCLHDARAYLPGH